MSTVLWLWYFAGFSTGFKSPLACIRYVITTINPSTYTNQSYRTLCLCTVIAISENNLTFQSISVVLIYANVYANRIILDDYDVDVVIWFVRGLAVLMSSSIEAISYQLGGRPTQYDLLEGSRNYSTVTNHVENIASYYLIAINLIVKVLTIRAEMSSQSGDIEGARIQIKKVMLEIKYIIKCWKFKENYCGPFRQQF